MKLTKQIEIDLTSTDIQLVLIEEGTIDDVITNMSNIVTYLRGIPKELLKRMETEQREAIARFLAKQSKKFIEV